MPVTPISRRHLLAGLGLGAVALGAGPLAACSSGSGTGANSARANAGVTLPKYIPYTGITADLPGNATLGVDPGFRHFPATNPRSVSEVPGHGETLTGMANIYNAVPPSADRNSYWKGLNQRLGMDLRLQMVPNADYEQKFATVVASDDLPDVMQLWPGANFPALLRAKFAPLDDHLGGDAISAYPNLANIPTMHWKSAVFNGGIYAIPIPRGRIRHYNFVRQDLIEAAGLNPEPKGWEEFLALCKALTDPKQRRWAMGSVTQSMYFFARMNDEPNVWREQGGKLTHAYETEEFKRSVQDVAELWKAGVIHPDGFNATAPFTQYFNAGTIAFALADGAAGWTQRVVDNQNTPGFKLGLMPVYNRAGSGLAAWHTGNGVFNLAGLKKQSDPKRVKLVLSALNWLAAPFGTEEYLYRVFGEQGVDHTRNADGDPVLTTQGKANTVVPVKYLADAPVSLYQPGRPADADYQHAFQTKVLAVRKDDPTLGLYSDTWQSKYNAANRTFVSARDDVIQARKPMSALDDAIKAFRAAVADQARIEYQEQLQQNGGPR